jgi:hypothetical protein
LVLPCSFGIHNIKCLSELLSHSILVEWAGIVYSPQGVSLLALLLAQPHQSAWTETLQPFVCSPSILCQRNDCLPGSSVACHVCGHIHTPWHLSTFRNSCRHSMKSKCADNDVIFIAVIGVRNLNHFIMITAELTQIPCCNVETS